MSNKEYTLFNVLFVALLFCLFMISLLVNNNAGLLACQVLKTTGEACKSCGLTRDFIAFSHFDFHSPNNEQSVFVYFWFLAQLIYRTVITFKPTLITNQLIKKDFIISTLTGILVFLPFWV